MTTQTNLEIAATARRRVLIVGGVAGGASTAARLRRLDEDAEIVIFERGQHVSFANCGLPYHVGNVIPDEASLLVASRELFRDRFAVEVFTEHEVTSIDRACQTLRVRDLKTGLERDERWDALVLAPGAAPLRPPLPGLELPGVFTVKTIPDTRRIRAFLDDKPRAHATVVGGGFIGLEMAENLVERGLQVTLIEKLPQVMPPLDADMAGFVALHLRQRGVDVRLSTGLAGVEARGERLAVHTDAATDIVRDVDTDLVILALGVRPEVTLAREAGLTIGARGGIVVDEQLRTSDPSILAVGDAIEVKDIVSGAEQVLPLAGPANRQGRVAAATLAGKHAAFRGVQGTAVVGVLGLTVATTGQSEKALTRAGRRDYHVVELHPGHHASYYPGAKALHLKLIFDTRGAILGAQAVGTEGVDKRIDVIATALQLGADVRQLAGLELCYAPQFGAAKDPVNVAGMMAVNVLEGQMPLADWDRLDEPGHLLLDVREPREFARGHIPGATNLPLSELRARLDEIPRDQPVWLCCAVGQRAYFAQRQLLQHGIDARNLSGGYATWQARRAAA
ncbi:MAG: FAD-dependent oxidoreductase [Deltaproteobacteria bacterium]|nr:FAD-dependent oxidoreductase [Deltaproteobacteria bacterium]